MSPSSLADPTAYSLLWPVVTTSPPNLLLSAISSAPRVRDCRFSSVVSGSRPSNVSASASRKPWNGFSIGSDCNRTPSAAHCSRARSLDSTAASRDGISPAVTLYDTLASPATATTPDDTLPPDRPYHPQPNPFFGP